MAILATTKSLVSTLKSWHQGALVAIMPGCEPTEQRTFGYDNSEQIRLLSLGVSV